MLSQWLLPQILCPFRPPKLYLPAAKFSPGLLWCASRWRVLQHLLRCFVCAMSPEGVMGMASYQTAKTWLEMLMQVYMISHSLTFCNDIALIWLSSLKLIEKMLIHDQWSKYSIIWPCRIFMYFQWHVSVIKSVVIFNIFICFNYYIVIYGITIHYHMFHM